MTTMSKLKQHAVVLVGLGIAITTSGLAAAQALPDAVDKTFKSKFPQAKITHQDSAVEEGVTVYAFEFIDGQTEKSADIAADGTMLEIATAIPAKELPEAAMKAVLKEAAGATIVFVDKVEITHETRKGYVYKLPTTVTQYEVQVQKNGAKGEVVVGPDGSVIDAVKWDKP